MIHIFLAFCCVVGPKWMLLQDENVTVDIVAIEDQKPDITSTQNDVTQVDQTQNKPSDMMDTSGVDEHIEITESKVREGSHP